MRYDTQMANAQNGMPMSRRAVPSQPTWLDRYNGTCTTSRRENTPIHNAVMMVYARFNALSPRQSASHARRCSVGSVRMNSITKPSPGTRTINEMASSTM